MNFLNKNRKFLIAGLLFFAFFFVLSTGVAFGAKDFVPLTKKSSGDIWNIQTQAGTGNTSMSISDLINNIYRYTIVISAMLAVIMITIGGFQYMGGGSYTTKGAGKERMTNAIIGILIVISAVLILNIINPNIAKLELFKDAGTVKTGGGGGSGQNNKKGDTSNTPDENLGNNSTSCNYTQTECAQKCLNNNYGSIDTYDSSLGANCCKCE